MALLPEYQIIQLTTTLNALYESNPDLFADLPEPGEFSSLSVTTLDSTDAAGTDEAEPSGGSLSGEPTFALDGVLLGQIYAPWQWQSQDPAPMWQDYSSVAALRTGDRSFYVDSTGVIRAGTTEMVPVDSEAPPPADALFVVDEPMAAMMPSDELNPFLAAEQTISMAEIGDAPAPPVVEGFVNVMADPWFDAASFSIHQPDENGDSAWTGGFTWSWG